MSGREVIARIDALEADTTAWIDALEASTTARIEALEASTPAQLHALDAQSNQLDMLVWGVGATFTMVTPLTAIGLINLVASLWPSDRHANRSPSTK